METKAETKTMVALKIRHCFVEKIYSGEKTVEFRRRALAPMTNYALYEVETEAITGSIFVAFSVGGRRDIVVDALRRLCYWKKAGVSEGWLSDYAGEGAVYAHMVIPMRRSSPLPCRIRFGSRDRAAAIFRVAASTENHE